MTYSFKIFILTRARAERLPPGPESSGRPIVGTPSTDTLTGCRNGSTLLQPVKSFQACLIITLQKFQILPFQVFQLENQSPECLTVHPWRLHIQILFMPSKFCPDRLYALNNILSLIGPLAKIRQIPTLPAGKKCSLPIEYCNAPATPGANKPGPGFAEIAWRELKRNPLLDSMTLNNILKFNASRTSLKKTELENFPYIQGRQTFNCFQFL